MRLVLQHADQVLRAIIQESVEIPAAFLEATDVYGSQSAGCADAQLVGAQSHDGAMFLMDGIDGASCSSFPSLGPDPERQDGC